MMLEFMIAPIYAAILFVSVTAALSIMLVLPYAIALGMHLPDRQTAKATAPASKKSRGRKANATRRAAKA